MGKRKCYWCDGTGRFKKPKDDDAFDKAFDRYDKLAHFISMGEMRQRALEDVGYTEIECPYCGGSGEENAPDKSET